MSQPTDDTGGAAPRRLDPDAALALQLRMSLLQHIGVIAITAFGGVVVLITVVIERILSPLPLTAALGLFAFSAITAFVAQTAIANGVERGKPRKRLVANLTGLSAAFFGTGMGAALGVALPLIMP